MVLATDAWLRFQYVFPALVNIAKILSAVEDGSKSGGSSRSHHAKSSSFGCGAAGHHTDTIPNAIDHVADWCHNVLSLRKVQQFLVDYERESVA